MNVAEIAYRQFWKYYDKDHLAAYGWRSDDHRRHWESIAEAVIREHDNQIRIAIRDLWEYVVANPKENMPDPVTQIAQIKTAVDTLKANQGTAPTTNFVTSDVQSALDSLSADVGTPTSTATPSSVS